MKNIALFILLAAHVNAKINIEILATDQRNNSQILIYGSEDAVISDTERNTFKLSDEKLKEAILKHKGAKPNDVLLKDPTPWGNIYSDYKWTQVSRTLKPVNYTIITMQSENKLVYTNIFNNTSSKNATFRAQIQTSVEDTVTSQWHNYGKLTLNKTIGYNIAFAAMAVTGQAEFSYVSEWGQQVAKSTTVTIGSKTGVDVSLEPGQELIAELYATRVLMKVQIEYEASLFGTVLANYPQMIDNHHFYGIDISNVCSAGKLTCKVSSTEVIDLAYYTDSTVILRDVDLKSVQKDYYNVITI